MLFDLDGTVWDSMPGIVGSLEHTFEVFGREVPERSVLTANIGPPLQSMLVELGFPPEQVDEATLVYRERYVEQGAFDAAVYPGISELLDELRARGHRLATATSKGEGPTHQMLEHFDLRHHFEVVGAASMDASAATKPAVIAKSLAGLGDPAPSDCLMVGDRSYDVTGAARFGIECVGVTWGFGDAEELHGAGAAHVIHEPAELIDLVERHDGGGTPSSRR